MKPRRVVLSDSVGIVVLAMLSLSLLATNVRRYRSAARSTTCSNNLKQLGLALHNYHAAYKQLPAGCGGTFGKDDSPPWQNNHRRLSAWVGMLPFFEEQKLWEAIANPYVTDERTFPPMGPVPWYDPEVYRPWGARSPTLTCPTDTGARELTVVPSYSLSYGDAVDHVGSPYDYAKDNSIAMAIRASDRGIFSASTRLRFRDCLDGLSNTLLFSERSVTRHRVAKDVSGLMENPAVCVKAHQDAGTQFWKPGREAVWSDGCLRSTGFQAILPPNAPSCSIAGNDNEGVMSASSLHSGGVHVAMADGAIRFVLDSIDAGDPTSPTVRYSRDGNYRQPGSQSAYGLWGALGTRASRETIPYDEPQSESIVDPPRELSDLQKGMLQSKPLQKWTASGGRGSVQARQVDLERQTHVVLMNEKGDVRRVRLSDLISQDAYRAVEQHLAEKLKAKTELKSQLKKGIELLDNKDFKGFAAQFLRNENAAPLAEMERGLFIYRLEFTLRLLESAGNLTVKEDRDGRMGLELPRSPAPASFRMNLVYQDGRWQFALQ